MAAAVESNSRTRDHKTLGREKTPTLICVKSVSPRGVQYESRTLMLLDLHVKNHNDTKKLSRSCKANDLIVFSAPDAASLIVHSLTDSTQ